MQDRISKFYKRFPVNMQIINLPIDSIRMAKYQKSLNKTRVEKIAEDYNPDRMRPIEVSFRNGHYWCWDGQHRVAAFKQMGFESIPAIIHNNLTYEGEARLFAEQQDNVGTVQTHHKWKALVEAKDNDTMKIISIAKKYGYEIGGSSASKGRIVAIKKISDVVKTLGFDGYESMLRVIHGAWRNEDQAACAEIMEGFRTFLSTYGKQPAYNEDRMIISLGKVMPCWILKQSTKIDASTPGQKVAKVLVSLYNKHLQIGKLK